MPCLISPDSQVRANKGIVNIDQTTKAFSDQSVSYPVAAKELAHSVGLKVSMILPMVDDRPSMVRSAALRNMALSLAKAFSIGLRSGL